MSVVAAGTCGVFQSPLSELALSSSSWMFRGVPRLDRISLRLPTARTSGSTPAPFLSDLIFGNVHHPNLTTVGVDGPVNWEHYNSFCTTVSQKQNKNGDLVTDSKGLLA